MVVIAGGDKEGKQVRVTIPKQLAAAFGIRKGTRLDIRALGKDRLELKVIKDE